MRHNFIRVSILIILIGGMISALFSQNQTYSRPTWSIGFAGGGGLSAMLNHNTFGFPEFAYKPSSIQTIGISFRYAPKPWSRIQLGVQVGRADYKYSDTWGPNTGTTETPMSIRKYIGLKFIQIPLTYRMYFYNEEKVLAFNRAESRKELEKPRLFYIIGGFQVTALYDATLTIQKNSDATNGKWENADLIDIKPGFDSYIPVHKLPDHLPENRSDLFAKTTLDAVLGAGLVLKLGSDIDIGLEGKGSFSLTDVNSSARNADGTYSYRFRTYSTTDPEPYTQAYIGNLSLLAVLNYSF